MRNFIIIIFVLSRNVMLEAQNEPPYFPQEVLVYSDCNTVNPSDCLYGKVKDRVKRLLLEKPEQLTFSKDTVTVHISFSVNKNGTIKDRAYTTVNDSTISKETVQNLNAIINDFTPFKVLNKKSKKYTTLHRFFYRFIALKDEDSNYRLKSIAPIEKNVYTGGQIQEVPRYANCYVKTEEQARKCFQKSILDHIRKNFRYPEEAQKLGLQGKVNVMFIIDKDGAVSSIRTRGPHKVLEDEARRITSLIPNMTPGKLNGKPVKIPFSIPIGFRLQ